MNSKMQPTHHYINVQSILIQKEVLIRREWIEAIAPERSAKAEYLKK
jgi:hypothetical protein